MLGKRRIKTGEDYVYNNEEKYFSKFPFQESGAFWNTNENSGVSEIF